jgi:hypothetical protein
MYQIKYTTKEIQKRISLRIGINHDFYCLRVVSVARTLTICFLRHIMRIEKVYPMRPLRKSRQLFLILSKRWMLQCCLQWPLISQAPQPQGLNVLPMTKIGQTSKTIVPRKG